MTQLSDPRHYQHTTAPTVPPVPPDLPGPRRYKVGDYVTMVPGESDPWVLHMQRHVRVYCLLRADDHFYGDDDYKVELAGVSADNALHGPIPRARLLPGWVAENGHVHRDVHGRRPQ